MNSEGNTIGRGMNEFETLRMDDGRESIWSVPKRFKSVYISAVIPSMIYMED